MNVDQKKALCKELRRMHWGLQFNAQLSLAFVSAIVFGVGYFLYLDFRLPVAELEKLAENTNAVVLFVSARLFIVIFSTIVCGLLIGVIRYNVLLSNFWLSRAHALELMADEEALSAKDLVALLSPEGIEFLSSGSASVRQIFGLAKQIADVSKTSEKV